MGKDLPRGDVPTLILAVLARGPCHGYAIARAIERESNEVLRLREGSLYPVLRELEQQQLVEGNWEIQESGPARKIYAISEAGRAELAGRTREWETYAAAMSALLGTGRLGYGS